VTDPHAYAVLAREVRFAGPLFSVVSDEVAMPGGGMARRDYLRHPGAVGVVAVDEHGQVVLIRQYRHPAGQFMWELPAGLADVVGEPAEVTAARELAEEADLLATRWEPLVEFFTSPGCSDERMQIFVARDLSPVPVDQRHRREQEEAELTVARFDLDAAVRMVFAGEIINGPCALGLLAAFHRLR